MKRQEIKDLIKQTPPPIDILLLQKNKDTRIG